MKEEARGTTVITRVSDMRGVVDDAVSSIDASAGRFAADEDEEIASAPRRLPFLRLTTPPPKRRATGIDADRRTEGER